MKLTLYKKETGGGEIKNNTGIYIIYIVCVNIHIALLAFMYDNI